MANKSRPKVATLFGVLNIIIGAFGVYGISSIGPAFQFSIINGILRLLSISVNVLLLVAGIFMLMNKKNSIDLNKYYSIPSLAINSVYAVYLLAVLGIFGFLGAIYVIIIGIIYPLLLWLLIVNNHPVKDFYASRS